jgi:hypothetical protein
MNMLNCRCAHSLYRNHVCSGEIVAMSLSPGTFPINVCSGCQQHILLHDQELVKFYQNSPLLNIAD